MVEQRVKVSGQVTDVVKQGLRGETAGGVRAVSGLIVVK